MAHMDMIYHDTLPSPRLALQLGLELSSNAALLTRSCHHVKSLGHFAWTGPPQSRFLSYENPSSD